MKKGVTVLEQFGMLNPSDLASNETALANFSQELVTGTVRAQLKGVKTTSGVSWTEALVKEIDRPISLPLKSLPS